MKGFIVGKIISTEPVPKSKMTKTLTDIGTEKIVVLTTVNVTEGQKVVVITIGTEVQNEDGTSFIITKRNMKEIDSFGMFHGDENGLINPEGFEVGEEYMNVHEQSLNSFFKETSKEELSKIVKEIK